MGTCYICSLGGKVTPTGGNNRDCESCHRIVCGFVVEEFYEGLTLAQIAIDFEVTVPTISKILTSMGIIERPRKRIEMLKYITKETP